MPVLSDNNPTLADLVKRMAPDDQQIANIVEILHETNDILMHVGFQEGNLLTGNRTTIRTGIPEATWRKLYGGIQPVKSTTAQVDDTCGTLEAMAEVDQQLADLGGNAAAFRMTESIPIIEGMMQQVADAMFYADERVNPEKFTGLAPRYNDLSANNADNIIDAGGSSNLTSIWLVVWGPNTCHGIVPKGVPGGLQYEDLGVDTIDNVDGQGGRMRAYRAHYRWQVGLTLRDWRHVVRIANIDTSALNADPSSSGINIPNHMFEAIERVHNMSAGRAAFYARREVITKLRQQLATLGASSYLQMEQVGGARVYAFHDIPLHRVDRISNTETEVT